MKSTGQLGVLPRRLSQSHSLSDSVMCRMLIVEAYAIIQSVIHNCMPVGHELPNADTGFGSQASMDTPKVGSRKELLLQY